MEDEWGEERFPSYLTLPTEKAGVISFLPFSSSLTNKSAHVTSLLEILKWLPCALQKTSKLLTMTGKAHPALVVLLLQPYFARHFPNSFCCGHTAHLWFREQARLIPTSPPLSLPGHHMLAPPYPSDLSSYVTCSERPSLTIPYGNLSVAIFVLLWFPCSSLFHQYISETIFSTYLLVL